jgi:hypothetical protein
MKGQFWQKNSWKTYKNRRGKQMKIMEKMMKMTPVLVLVLVLVGCDDGGNQNDNTPTSQTELDIIVAPAATVPVKDGAYLKITITGVTPEYIPVKIVQDTISGIDWIRVETTDERIVSLCEFPNGTSGSPLVRLENRKDTILGGLSHKLVSNDCKDIKKIKGLVTPIEDMRNGARLKPNVVLVPDGYVPIGTQHTKISIVNNNQKLFKPIADFLDYTPIPGAPIAFCIINGDVVKLCVEGAITAIEEKNGEKVFLAFGHPLEEPAKGLTGPVFAAIVYGQEFDDLPGSAHQLMSIDTRQQGCVGRETFWGISGKIGGDDCSETTIETTVVDVDQKTKTTTKRSTHEIIRHEAWPSLITAVLVDSINHAIGFDDNNSLFAVRGFVSFNNLPPVNVDYGFCGILGVGQGFESIMRFSFGRQPEKMQLVITKEPLQTCSFG